MRQKGPIRAWHTTDYVASNSTRDFNMAYQWSACSNELLNAHIKYHQNICAYLHQLQQEGPELCEEMPKKPRGNISSLLNPKPSIKLSGRELHEYLRTKMADDADNLKLQWDPTDLTKIRDTLVAGYKVLQRNH